jgi:cyclophilin family peptidyl-prolyl cis-trans isomerase
MLEAYKKHVPFGFHSRPSTEIPMLRFGFLASAFGLMFAALSSTAPAQDGKNPIVVLDTTAGKIVIELYADKAPGTVKNFLQYVDDKHYDGTIFHRVIENFMIQGGGFEAGMRERKTRESIKNESDNGLSNERGTLAMARTPNPHSASSQFFINVKANDFLDKAKARDKWGYCVFGRVIEGLDVVDEIRKVQTGSKGGHDDVPLQDVVIRTARRKQ